MAAAVLVWPRPMARSTACHPAAVLPLLPPCLQRLRQALGWWLYIVAPLVPLKSAIFAGRQQQQQQQETGAGPALPAAAAATAAAAAEQPAGIARATSSSSSSKHGLLQELLQPPSAASAASGLALAATGSLAGFASGLLGIGGGTGALRMQHALHCGSQLCMCASAI